MAVALLCAGLGGLATPLAAAELAPIPPTVGGGDQQESCADPNWQYLPKCKEWLEKYRAWQSRQGGTSAPSVPSTSSPTPTQATKAPAPAITVAPRTAAPPAAGDPMPPPPLVGRSPYESDCSDPKWNHLPVCEAWQEEFAAWKARQEERRQAPAAAPPAATAPATVADTDFPKVEARAPGSINLDEGGFVVSGAVGDQGSEPELTLDGERVKLDPTAAGAPNLGRHTRAFSVRVAVASEGERRVRLKACDAARNCVQEMLTVRVEPSARAAAEEKARREAEAKRIATAQARREAEEKARREAEERAQALAREREEAEKARREAEERAKRLAAELEKQRLAAERAQREADEKLRRDAAEREKREAEAKTRREAAEREKELAAKREKELAAKLEEERAAAEQARQREEEGARQASQELAALTRDLRPMNELRKVLAGDTAVRVLPKAGAEEVRKLAFGEQVHVVGALPSGWVQIAREGVAYGWVHGSALQQAQGEARGSSPATQAALPFVDRPNVKGRNHALIIGNNQYANLPDLKTAVTDAAALSELLKVRYLFNSQDVRLLLNADRRQILDEMARFRGELGPEDRLLIYYAGHGQIDEATGTGYWQPVDAELDRRYTWISNDDVRREIQGLPAKHVLVIADSCFSGTLMRSASPFGEVNKDRFFTEIDSSVSRKAITSGGTEPVADAGSGGHSVFAYYLLKALRDNQKPYIASFELFTEFARAVTNNSAQKPNFGTVPDAGDEGSGDFTFILR